MTKKTSKFIALFILPLFLIYFLSSHNSSHEKQNNAESSIEILNVSYDPTRELYADYNNLFQEYWKNKTGQSITIKQSNGGSGAQSRAIIDGLKADVATLALAYDIDAIAEKTNKIPSNWQKRLPHNSSPYTSTIVFLVRKGNPKGIHDWGDLVKPNISVITPNPKTSGGARWNYLAAWAYADKIYNRDETKIKSFIKKLYLNVPVLDTGARGSTTTFVKRGIGDVLIAWENEAFLAINELGKDNFEIVIPSISILAEPPVALIDKNTSDNGTTEVARNYLSFLYSEAAQELIAKHYFRPINPTIVKKYKNMFPKINMVTIDKDFGGWKKAQEIHFGDGGNFDKIYKR